MFLLGISLPSFPEEYLHHRIAATVLAADPEQAAERVTRWAEEKGGYYLLRSGEKAVVRFPAAEIGALRSLLEGMAEGAIGFTPQAVDLREELLGIRSAIRSREEILARNVSYLDQANVTGTLAIEKEVLALLGEIEQLKGRLNRLEVDRRMALAEVSFRFQEQSIPTDIPSSFDWINTIDYFSFMQGGFFGEYR
jgi:hypothetical protein